MLLCRCFKHVITQRLAAAHAHETTTYAYLFKKNANVFPSLRQKSLSEWQKINNTFFFIFSLFYSSIQLHHDH